VKGVQMHDYSMTIRNDAPFLAYSPIVFTSARTGRGIHDALDMAILCARNHAMRLSTGEINRIVQDAVDSHPLSQKGKQFKIYYATMPAVKPPTIVLFVNDPEMLHFSYERYLENQIRKVHPYAGTPIRIFARKAESRQDQKK
jgi:GTPase